MPGPQALLAERVRAAITGAFGSQHSGADPLIRPSAFADFQSNAALPLATVLRRSPREVAREIAAHIDLAGICETPEISGPGFLNFTLASSWIATEATRLLDDRRLGVRPAGQAQAVVVDYSGPNVAKELHVGHLRATAVGDAVVRILEFLGHTVTRAAHLGDWGTQFGMLIEHLLDTGEAAAHAQLAAGELTAFYQAAHARFDSGPIFAERSRRRVSCLQSGDTQTLRLWRMLVSESMDYLTRIYARLDITLSAIDMAPESFYNDMLAGVCAELQDAGIARMSEGALCAFPPGFTGREGTPLPLMLRKIDGGYGYGTTDVAAIRYRLVDLKANRLIYVVGAEQAQREQIAEAVGIGALKYADLSVARHSSYAFDVGRMLAMTGDTGPYLQYATARIRSIFRRAGTSPDDAAGPILVTEDAERALALVMLGFGTAVWQAADRAEPHVLAGFLFRVASAFTAFFEQCPVLRAASEPVRESRLALSALTLRVLATGLGLLGVPVPERM